MSSSNKTVTYIMRQKRCYHVYNNPAISLSYVVSTKMANRIHYKCTILLDNFIHELRNSKLKVKTVAKAKGKGCVVFISIKRTGSRRSLCKFLFKVYNSRDYKYFCKFTRNIQRKFSNWRQFQKHSSHTCE